MKGSHRTNKGRRRHGRALQRSASISSHAGPLCRCRTEIRYGNVVPWREWASEVYVKWPLHCDGEIIASGRSW